MNFADFTEDFTSAAMMYDTLYFQGQVCVMVDQYWIYSRRLLWWHRQLQNNIYICVNLTSAAVMYDTLHLEGQVCVMVDQYWVYSRRLLWRHRQLQNKTKSVYISRRLPWCMILSTLSAEWVLWWTSTGSIADVCCGDTASYKIRSNLYRSCASCKVQNILRARKCYWS